MRKRNGQTIASDEVFVKSLNELDSFRKMEINISFSTTWVILPLPLLHSEISNHIFINMASWIQYHLFAVQMPHLCISEERAPEGMEEIIFLSESDSRNINTQEDVTRRMTSLCMYYHLTWICPYLLIKWNNVAEDKSIYTLDESTLSRGVPGQHTS